MNYKSRFCSNLGKISVNHTFLASISESAKTLLRISTIYPFTVLPKYCARKDINLAEVNLDIIGWCCFPSYNAASSNLRINFLLSGCILITLSSTVPIYSFPGECRLFKHSRQLSKIIYSYYPVRTPPNSSSSFFMDVAIRIWFSLSSDGALAQAKDKTVL